MNTFLVLLLLQVCLYSAIGGEGAGGDGPTPYCIIGAGPGGNHALLILSLSNHCLSCARATVSILANFVLCQCVQDCSWGISWSELIVIMSSLRRTQQLVSGCGYLRAATSAFVCLITQSHTHTHTHYYTREFLPALSSAQKTYLHQQEEYRLLKLKTI